jgi:adenine-specific DNA-methyltransferase
MPKIEITRTELAWPGKYDEDGNLVPPRRVNLPFQVIERVNETRATREQRQEKLAGHVGTLFDYWRAEEEQMAGEGDGWRNKLIWGDNLYVMGSLLEHFAGKIDLIYIDPPFATGADFSFVTEVGASALRLTKEQSIIEEKAYRDTWGHGLDSYLQMMAHRLALMHDLLSGDGNIVVHLAPTVSAHLRIAMDEVFGPDNFRSEIIVHRPISKNLQRQFAAITSLPQGHDVLLWYSSTPESRVPNLLVPYEAPHPEGYWHRFWSGADRPSMRYELLGETPSHGQWKWERERAMRAVKNYEHFLKKGKGRSLVEYWRDKGCQLEFIRKSATGAVENWFPPRDDKIADTVWDDVKAYENQKEYPTQKHRELLGRIVEWLTEPSDLVADFFCGSGTTFVVAEKLGRRWIGCDMSRYAIHTTRKRLMDIPDCRPFEILNLGQYERQVWQGVTFGGQKRPQQMLIFEYLKFILDLYGAQPLAGTQHLHGKKGSAVIHVGAVDAPVTIDEINACLAECQAMRQKELHVLGWEWEMGLANLMVDQAKAQGVKLLLLNIPREVMEQQAVEKGDIHFYELAYLEVDIHKTSEVSETSEVWQVTVTLTDFVIPNDELIPPDVRAKIRKWSDYVDYWAVDWDFQNDTFVNAWTSYRTRRDRTLQLKTDPHVYDVPGTYRVLVKVIDICAG